MVVAQYSEQQIPYDHAAEVAVLGALLIDGESLHLVSSIIKPEDFHRARNRFCFAACIAVSQRGEAVDPITVGRELQRHNRLEEVGGSPYLGQLISDTPTSVNVEYYAGIVAETAAKRRIIDAGNRIAELGFEDGNNAEESMRRALDVLFSVQPAQTGRGFVPLAIALDRYLQSDVDDLTDDVDTPRYTGYEELDLVLGGVMNSDLVIVGARPGMGKSSLALNICVNLAKDGATCGVFSLEMGLEQVAARILGTEAGIPANMLTQGLFTESAVIRLVDAVGVLSDLQIYIDDTPVQTVTEMRSKAQRLQMEHGLDFLVVDYLQLVHGNGRGGGENRVQEISEISRMLKATARDLHIPVLACSQLNRALETRPSRRPQLADLRDSGSIEQDADIVMFIYRDDKAYTEEQWYEMHPAQPYPIGVSELIVAKHRHGPTGEAYLYFREEFTRFENMRSHELATA